MLSFICQASIQTCLFVFLACICLIRLVLKSLRQESYLLSQSLESCFSAVDYLKTSSHFFKFYSLGKDFQNRAPGKPKKIGEEVGQKEQISEQREKCFSRGQFQCRDKDHLMPE